MVEINIVDLQKLKYKNAELLKENQLLREGQLRLKKQLQTLKTKKIKEK